MAYLVTYQVDAGSHEGYRCATVLSCVKLDRDLSAQVIGGGEEPLDKPIKRFRWWYAETQWIELRVQGKSVKVGARVDDLPEMGVK